MKKERIKVASMVRVVVTSLVILVSNSLSSAQKLSPDCWHPGQVVLASSDTVIGFLKYHIDDDLLQLKVAGKVRTYAPNQITEFVFTDSITGKNRKMLVREYVTSKDYTRPFFFELLSDGATQLFGREFIILETRGNLATQGFNNTYRALSYGYWLFNGTSMVRFVNKKKEVLEIMNDRSVLVEQFRKEHKIKLNRHKDVIRLFDYYNELKKNDQRTGNTGN